MNRINKKYKLSDVCDFIGGSQPPKTAFSSVKKEGYVRLIQIRDYKSDAFKTYIRRNSTKKFCAKDDIMIGRYGPPVFQILKGLEGAYNVALMKAIPDEALIDKDYLFWFLNSPDIQNYIISLSQRSAGQSGVNKTALNAYEIILPELKKQKFLVSKINSLFERIDQSIFLLEENIKYAGNFFKSILDKTFNELSSNTKFILLEDVTSKIGSGSTPKGGQKSYKTEGISLIRSMNVHDSEFKAEGLAFIDESQAEKLNNVTIEKDDVLLNITGASVARCCIVNNNYLPARVNQHVSIIRPDKNLNPYFLHYYLISPTVKSKLIYGSGGGATREAITKSMICNFEVPVPNMKEQLAVTNQLNILKEKTNLILKEQQSKLNHLEALKASILDSAFKGEL